jgi:hypothetical protein
MPLEHISGDSVAKVKTEREFVRIPRDFFENPVFKKEPATVRGAFIWIATMGRILRVTVGDLSREWGVHDRRAVQIIKTLERGNLISVSGSGRCRLICVETDLVQTCGFYVSAEAQFPIGSGAAKWRGPALPAALRDKILARDHSTCSYCGETEGPMHIDHIKPVALGGTDAISNLTTACAACNLSKGPKPLYAWKGRVQ